MSDATGSDLASELAALAARIRLGDKVAEHELGARYLRAIRAIVRRHCRPNEAQIDDIAQDVLADILKRLRAGLIDDPQALPHYLQLAIRHSCTAFYKREQKMQTDAPDVEDAAPGSDPLDFHVRQQRARLLRELLDELPVARDRELLRRFYLLEETRDSVCAQLGIDTGHFHRVIHRARERLRQVMDRHGYDDL